MSSETVITVKNISKTYYLGDKSLLRLFQRKKNQTGFKALQNISLTVTRGQTVGIIGRNGSGKSTLLQIIAGILKPCTGTITTKGKVAALLELGAGFNLEFSGQENVYLNAAIMGISKREITKKMPAIVEFAGIGAFINYPVKTYSSGMLVRLAFAVAINIAPEILIIDEALSVGDAAFQHKCFSKLKEMQKKGVTILFVSHDTDSVKSFCQQAILLEQGQIIYQGDAETAVNKYYELIHLEQTKTSTMAPLVGTNPDNGSNFQTTDRHGTGAAQFVAIDFIDQNGLATENITFGDPVTVRLGIRFHQKVNQTNVGILWRDSSGIDVLGNDSLNLGQAVPAQKPGKLIHVDFTVQNFYLKPGSYALTVALGEIKAGGVWNATYFDWLNNAKILKVQAAANTRVWTKVLLPMQINIY